MPGGSQANSALGGPAADAAGAASRDNASAIVIPMADRTFAKFSFFKVDPAWRRRDPELRAADKQEFLAACEDFGIDRSLRAYSTIGTRGDVDLVLLSQSSNLGDIHTFHVVLGQSGLAKWTETPYSFLSMTKRSPYSDEQARPEICSSERKYLFLYPMVKQRRWYGLPAEERGRIMKSHIEVGRRYPEITINTTYSFGLDDQELRATFNGGLGMTAVVPPSDVKSAIAVLAEHGVPAAVVGEVVEAAAIGGARYVEGALESIA